MTRCSYIPPEGQSVIAIAKERGGTTDGDIAALVDRLGCRAEARWEVSAEASGGPWKDPACSDHVGHMLHDGANDVRPIEVSDATIGIARAGFGPPIVLSNPGADRLALNLAASEAWRARGCPPGEITPEPDGAQ